MKIKAILSAIGLGIAGIVAFFFAAKRSGAAEEKQRSKEAAEKRAEVLRGVEHHLDGEKYTVKYRDSTNEK